MTQVTETVEDLEGRQVDFQPLTERIDTNSSDGKLVFQSFGAVSELKPSMIGERTRAWLVAARVYGGTGCRPPVLDEKDKAARLAIRRGTSVPVKEAAHCPGISVAALGHHFPRGRSAVLEYATERT